MGKYGKFAALIVIVVGTLVWLATAGMKERDDGAILYPERKGRQLDLGLG